MKEIDQLQKIYIKKQRVFRNWDAAYNTMNTFQQDYDDYLSMLPRMKNYAERLEKIQDPAAKAKAEAEREHFLSIEPKCAGLKAVNKALFISRQVREKAQGVLKIATDQLLELRNHEKKLANHISDDHVVADEQVHST